MKRLNASLTGASRRLSAEGVRESMCVGSGRRIRKLWTTSALKDLEGPSLSSKGPSRRKGPFETKGPSRKGRSGAQTSLSTLRT